MCEEAVVFGPSQEAARARELGDTAFRRRDFPEARRHYERAVGWQPEEMGNWSNLARVMMETQAYREVRELNLIASSCAVCSAVTFLCSVQCSSLPV